MYEYRQIIYRLRRGQKIRAIAKEGLAGRDKIKEIKVVSTEYGWLDPDAALPADTKLHEIFGQRPTPQQTSKVDPYAELIERWVQEGIQAKVIHQHLQSQHGFEGAYNSVQRFVKKIKVRTPDLTVPLHFQPGEAAQVDFGYGPILYDERTGREEKTWFFIMMLCWSRHQYVELVTHQDIETWLNCHQNAFNWFGGVVNKVIIDNPKCAITKACYYEPEVQRSYEELAQSYEFIISACPPRDPQKKGRVESGVKYVKRNFLPLRTFKSLQDANQQLKRWILQTAGNRHHGSTYRKPLSQFSEIEQQQLKPLPKNPPEIASWYRVKPYRNCHVRHQKNFYSVPHALYGKALWLKLTPTTVTVYDQHQLIAMHPRLFGVGGYSTKHEHLPNRARFYFTRNEDWCLVESKAIGTHTEQVVKKLLADPTRDLLRAAQGVLALKKTYGAKRLEQACQRAIYFNAVTQQTIKKILSTGLDAYCVDEERTSETLQKIYQGEATYQRQPNN